MCTGAPIFRPPPLSLINTLRPSGTISSSPHSRHFASFALKRLVFVVCGYEIITSIKRAGGGRAGGLQATPRIQYTPDYGGEDDDDNDDNTPVSPTWAVGALFRGARRIHINRICFHIASPS
jgi:hypothetical protein